MEFTTSNGRKEVKILPAPFKAAGALKKAVLKSLLSVDKIENINLEKLDTVALLNGISKLLINMETSDDFEKAVMDCLKVCIYDEKHKITEQLFDDIPEAREDYYEIVTKCCEVNLRPFFKSLISEFKTRFPQAEKFIPEQ